MPVTEQCDVVGQSSCTVGERLLIGPLIQYGLRLLIMRRTAEKKDYAVTVFICLCTPPLPSVVVSVSETLVREIC